MKTAGIMLIVVGILTTVFTGFNFFTEKKVLDVGRLEVTKDEKHTVNWPPYVGIGLILLGGGILLFGRKSKGLAITTGFLLIGFSSCTTGKEGCYTGKAYPDGTELKVASSIPAPKPGELMPVAVEVISPETISNPVSEQIAVLEDDEFRDNEVVLIAEAPTREGEMQAASITALMATDLRKGAGLIERKFVNRILTKTANRLEGQGFSSNSHKFAFWDKLKMKLTDRYYAKHVAAAAAGDGGVLAIVSLVTGIVAFAAYYGAFALGLVAIITGAIALAQGTSRRVMAVLGIVFGALAIALWSGLIVVI